MFELFVMWGQVVIVTWIIVYSFLGLFWLYLKCTSGLSALGSYIGSKYRKTSMIEKSLTGH